MYICDHSVAMTLNAVPSFQTLSYKHSQKFNVILPEILSHFFQKFLKWLVFFLCPSKSTQERNTDFKCSATKYNQKKHEELYLIFSSSEISVPLSLGLCWWSPILFSWSILVNDSTWNIPLLLPKSQSCILVYKGQKVKCYSILISWSTTYLLATLYLDVTYLTSFKRKTWFETVQFFFAFKSCKFLNMNWRTMN